jgi:hypothetical protein
VGDRSIAFEKTFWPRLVIAIAVTRACFTQVNAVRRNMDWFGPPAACDPFDTKYNPCDCTHTFEHCKTESSLLSSQLHSRECRNICVDLYRAADTKEGIDLSLLKGGSRAFKYFKFRQDESHWEWCSTYRHEMLTSTASASCESKYGMCPELCAGNATAEFNWPLN